MAGTFGTKMREGQREVERNKEKQGRSEAAGEALSSAGEVPWCGVIRKASWKR